jgi:amino-acid N-acetyltransferase
MNVQEHSGMRAATVRDVPALTSLINEAAQKGLVLPKSLNQVYQNIRDFSVYEDDGRIVGCGALHVLWDDLAEVRSLVVREDLRRRGIGGKVVRRLLGQGRTLGVTSVFALTYQRAFFEGLGFRMVDKEELPRKIWADCIDCVKFPNCDEVAVILAL